MLIRDENNFCDYLMKNKNISAIAYHVVAMILWVNFRRVKKFFILSVSMLYLERHIAKE